MMPLKCLGGPYLSALPHRSQTDTCFCGTACLSATAKKKHPKMRTGGDADAAGFCDLDADLERLSLRRRDVISIVFVGHVDAGKSTIGGQVLNKLGLIDKRTLEKYRAQAREKNRESWYLSWALDTDEGERERGKTAEVGRAYFYLPSKKVILLDAPGHSMYVSDMINGANQADIAVLVVSARRNEFEAGFEKDGQTREHVYLSRAGGIKKMIVLVNKMDEADWDEERFNYIQNKLKAFLHRIYSMQEVVYIPVSGISGENILEKHGACTWYTGETFLGFLDKVNVVRQVDTLFSFTVVDKVRAMGVIVYEGKVETGRLKSSGVVVLPRGIETAIAGIYDQEDVEIDEAATGDFVRIKLKENYEQIEEGDVIMEAGCTGFVVSDEFVCALTILETPSIICAGYRCVLHLRMNQKECKIMSIAAMVDKKIVRRRFARRGEKVLVKIKVDAPIVLTNWEESGTPADMFALRTENITVGLGVVKKIAKAQGNPLQVPHQEMSARQAR